MGPACHPGADVFIAHVFKDCVYNFRDYTGFILGLASLLTWMVAQFPQIISNFKNKSAEALSVWFLGEWLLGDTCNLIGCLLTGNQLVTQIYTAMYFVCADVVLCLQYVYYNTIRHRRQRALRNLRYRSLRPIDDSPRIPDIEDGQDLTPHRRHSTKSRALACLAIVALGGQYTGNFGFSGPSMQNLEAHGRILMNEGAHRRHDAEWSKYVGQVIGWISSVLYLGSRLSQIYKTWRRQSAEGLSIAMFICAISANILYGAGILIRAYSLLDVISSAPWLVGSLGTVLLDVIIFCQFRIYKNSDEKQRLDNSEEEPLSDEERPL